MTPEVLTAAGRVLYGPDHWRTPLADALDVSTRTLQRWVAGQSEIPPRVADDILFMVAQRKTALGSIEARLKRVAA